MTTPVIPQRENKTLAAVIDEAVIESAKWATELEIWLQSRRGPYMPIFEEFYRGFSMLLTLTGDLSEMGKHQESGLVDRCRAWVKPVRMDGKGTEKELGRLGNGVALFHEYYHALNYSGVITLRK
jgi:hypothetical protein